MIGSILGYDPPGNYPLNVYGNKYACRMLGENVFCQKVCKLHGGHYGYCFNSRCWCEYLEKKDVNIWDAVKHYCNNTIVYSQGK
nr:putative beta-like toxin Tx651 [Buthus occitanus israelis]